MVDSGWRQHHTEVYDSKGRTFIAGSALGDGSQAEGQKPDFRLVNGATLKIVVLGSSAEDEIHTYGDAYLSNTSGQISRMRGR
ncbi:pectate lyase [Paenibacillus terricola]|uniref:pectate lyase n=1 Tax=Paenibacillus terricola TaxID=2763503 RepID=UPI001CD0C352|nr:pectate lyase [Paenibacillus terricola]